MPDFSAETDYSAYLIPEGFDSLSWVISLSDRELEREAMYAEEMRITRKYHFPKLPLTRYELAEAVYVERIRKDLK